MNDKSGIFLWLITNVRIIYLIYNPYLMSLHNKPWVSSALLVPATESEVVAQLSEIVFRSRRRIAELILLKRGVKELEADDIIRDLNRVRDITTSKFLTIMREHAECQISEVVVTDSKITYWYVNVEHEYATWEEQIFRHEINRLMNAKKSSWVSDSLVTKIKFYGGKT